MELHQSGYGNIPYAYTSLPLKQKSFCKCQNMLKVKDLMEPPA